MTESRIFFPENPWPEGHRIAKFEWTAEVTDGDLWFFFHLETDRYDAERQGNPGPDEGPDVDWKAESVWTNYGHCSLSATKWGDETGFLVGRFSKFNLDRLSGREFLVDRLPLKEDDAHENRAFHVYLLGHDDVADHRIRFSRDQRTGLFDISWEGKIALAYMGDYEFKHSFAARIYGVEAPAILKKRSLRLLLPWL
jgi:hypothetical protein